jgi:A/G-specific adenine glycosylase
MDVCLNLPLTDQLLSWFDVQRRDLPWRDAPCGARDPYRVWLAEIMLQQTTVTAVLPYYRAFLAKWPDVKALANADDDAVMHAWAGLGYYARARNMLKCAREVVHERQGGFPRFEADLVSLPGVGPYTAAAIAAMAFNASSAPVDGNVIRTLSRLYAIDAEMPKGKALVEAKARALLPEGRSGDFAEALMDLGSGVCRAKNPDCPACPWVQTCRAWALGDPAGYPRKGAKAAKPTRRGWIFWVQSEDGRILVERRPDKGLLGGMIGFPTSEWSADVSSAKAAAAPWMAPPWNAETWTVSPGLVKHTFTHFHLQLQVMRVVTRHQDEGVWCPIDDLSGQALPSVMQKVVRHALN